VFGADMFIMSYADDCEIKSEYYLYRSINEFPSEIRYGLFLLLTTGGLIGVQWLNELVFLFDTYNYIGRRYSVNIVNKKLKAIISGGTFDPSSTESRLLIKAATYHDLSLIRTNTNWEATIIFDI
jgi:hypothetical protein